MARANRWTKDHQDNRFANRLPDQDSHYKSKQIQLPPNVQNGARLGGSYNQGFNDSNALDITKKAKNNTQTIVGAGGVKITINKDSKYLKNKDLTTDHKENMNLMFYDFNNPSMIPEEDQSERGCLRSQTTDRGPSRNFRSRGRFKLGTSQNPRSTFSRNIPRGDIRENFTQSSNQKTNQSV